MKLRITSNINNVIRQLEEFERRAKSINGMNQIRLIDLFPPTFMARYTEFASIDEMFEKGGFKFDSQEEFERTPGDDLNRFVAAHTRFQDWRAMQAAAANEWTKKKLGL